MKLDFRVYGVALLMLAFGVGGATVSGEILEWVVAVVNNHPITHGELQESMNALLVQLPRQLDEEEMKELQQQVLDRMIDDRLLLAEAKRQGITISDKELDVMVARELKVIKSRYDSNVDFRIMLGRMGLSEDGFKDELRDKMLREYLTNSLVRRRVIASVEVSDVELARFQEQEPERYADFAQVRVSHILLLCEPDATAEESKRLYEKAQAIAMRGRSGEDFGQLAVEFSEHEPTREEGGDLGYFKRGELFPELENAAMSLQVGEVSDPVRTEKGYHVILVTGKRSPKEYLLSVKAKEELAEYLKTLREKAQIEIFEGTSGSVDSK